MNTILNAIRPLLQTHTQTQKQHTQKPPLILHMSDYVLDAAEKGLLDHRVFVPVRTRTKSKC